MARAIAAGMWVAGVLCVLPLFVVLAGAFLHEGRPSLEPVAAAFADGSRTVELLCSTVKVAAGSVAVSCLLGVPAGFLCFRTNLLFRRAMLFACVLAACMPLYVTATCWMALFGMRFWLYSPWGASWIHGVAYAPLVALLSGLAFAGADRDLEETAAMDGGTAVVLRHAVLPGGAWGIAVSAMAVTILSLWDITVTDILMVRTFAEEVFTQFQLGGGAGRAAAVSLPAVFMIGLLWIAAAALVGGRGEGTFWGRAVPAKRWELGPARYLLAGVVIVVATACFLVPFGALVRAVGSVANLLTSWRTASRELLGTLQVVPLAATLATILAAPAAWALARSGRWRWPILAGLLLLIAVPSPLAGIGLVELLNRPGIAGAMYDSMAGLAWAYVMRGLPFAALALWPAMKAIPREAEEAIALDGGGVFDTFRHVVLPATWRAMLAAWFLAFVLAMGDMGASFLVAPPGRATLSTRFFTLIHYGVYPDAAGICLILMGIVGVAALAVAGLAGGRLRGEECPG